MKNISFSIILLLISLPLFSQKVKVRNVRKLAIEEKAWFPQFGKNQKEILLSGQNYQGLKIYNVKEKEITEISNSLGAGSNITTTSDGSIIFSEKKLQNGRTVKLYKKYNPESKEIVNIPSASAINFRTRASAGEIIIFKNEKEIKRLSPVKDRNLIWTSVSPDQTMILFTAAGDGTYICDFEGNILYSLGHLNSPVWINNQWVLGMDDEDNGEVLLSSEIICTHIPSLKRFNLTKKFDGIAQYPKPSPEENKIVFHSPEGSIYTMKIKLKDR